MRKLEIRTVVSNAKSHQERGRVERRIKTIRDTLAKMGEGTTVPQTSLQWETVFAKIANTINDLPIAKGDSTNANDVGFEILTPNRIIMGRNNKRGLAGDGINLEMSSNLQKMLNRNHEIYAMWYQLYIDNIHLLSLKPSKWLKSDDQPKIGDVALFVMKEVQSYRKSDAEWRLGLVVGVQPRKITLEFSGRNKKGEKSRLERNPREVCILLGAEELAINSKEYFQRLLTSNGDG